MTNDAQTRQLIELSADDKKMSMTFEMYDSLICAQSFIIHISIGSSERFRQRQHADSPDAL